jgi:hypothetical protein
MGCLEVGEMSEPFQLSSLWPEAFVCLPHGLKCAERPYNATNIPHLVRCSALQCLHSYDQHRIYVAFPFDFGPSCCQLAM